MGQNHYVHLSFEKLSSLQVEVRINQNSKLKIPIKLISHLSTKIQIATFIYAILYMEIKSSFSNMSCRISWFLVGVTLPVLAPDFNTIWVICTLESYSQLT